MPGHWFRCYDELIDDPKIQRLSGDLRGHLFNIWCLASANEGILPPISDLAFRLRLSLEEATHVVNSLRTNSLLEVDANGTLRPHNWDGRQFKSDHSDPTHAERKRRQRERERYGKERTGYRTESHDRYDERNQAEERQEVDRTEGRTGDRTAPRTEEPQRYANRTDDEKRYAESRTDPPERYANNRTGTVPSTLPDSDSEQTQSRKKEESKKELTTPPVESQSGGVVQAVTTKANGHANGHFDGSVAKRAFEEGVANGEDYPVFRASKAWILLSQELVMAWEKAWAVAAPEPSWFDTMERVGTFDISIVRSAVLAAISRKKDGPAGSWNYFNAAIAREHDRLREARARPVVAPKLEKELTDAQWSVVVKMYRETGEWPQRLGPAPGLGGCRCPSDVQKSYNFKPREV
jgi:hypothetical protein